VADGKQLISKTEYAKHRGVSQAMVSHWTNGQRIQIVDGKVDVEASDAMLAAGQDPTRGGKGGRPKHQQRPRAPADDGGSLQPPPSMDAFSRVRTVREGYRARSEEVAYRKLIGELVEREKWAKALADGLTPLLAALDSLGPRLAQRLVGETDPRVIQNLIEDAVAVSRQDAADTMRRLITGAL
jgi:hypothetical protein